MVVEQGKRMGRPPRDPDRARSRNVTFRARDDVYELLARNSKARGISLSEEAESQILAAYQLSADPIVGSMMKMIAANWTAIEAIMKSKMIEDDFVATACAEAAKRVVLNVTALTLPAIKDPDADPSMVKDAEAFGRAAALVHVMRRSGIGADLTEIKADMHGIASRRGETLKAMGRQDPFDPEDPDNQK